MSFAVVVAADEADGIGRAGALPWRLPGDLAFFRELTSTTRAPGARNAVILGRRTWESLPERFRPLPGRLNVVVSRRGDLVLPEGVARAPSLDEALSIATALGAEAVFAIGGGELYRESLAHPACDTVYLTRVEGRFPCDTFFPPIGPHFTLAEQSPRHEDDGIGYRFQRWQRRGSAITEAAAATSPARPGSSRDPQSR